MSRLNPTPEPTARGGYRFAPLLERVVDGGFCIGCGACAAVPEAPLVMRLQADGLYRPEIRPGRLDDENGPDLGQVCPFYADDNEDTLAQSLYPDAPQHRDALGYFRQCYAGWVTDSQRRAHSSSGGLASWVLEALLADHQVDGVIHVTAVEDDPEAALFRYQIGRRAEQIGHGAKTRYYPVEFSQVMGFVRDNPGRYAFVGVPCFVKALRLLAKRDPAIDQAITYTIGLFCGHMKSTAYAQYLAWQVGVPPAALAGIDFRRKRDGLPANRYGITVQARWPGHGKAQARTAGMEELDGGDWGVGLFKPRACDFCDDVAGETADLVCGDAWLPEYVGDSRGTNLVIVRHPALERLLIAGCKRGAIALERIAPERVTASQAASYRHRGEGLRVRLSQWDRTGRWRPRKRVEPQLTGVSRRQRWVYALRMIIAERSHSAYARARRLGHHRWFRLFMIPWVLGYRVGHRGALRALLGPLWRRVRRRWSA